LKLDFEIAVDQKGRTHGLLDLGLTEKIGGPIQSHGHISFLRPKLSKIFLKK
jgi:hypothetical protein